MLQLEIKKILGFTHSVYPESESDHRLDSCYNLKLEESEGPTNSIYPETESDPGLDSRYKSKL